MQTRCTNGWNLFVELCLRYGDVDRPRPGPAYQRTLEAYRQHHQDCAQCHGRTAEQTELAAVAELPQP